MQSRSQRPEKRRIQTRRDGGRAKRRPDPLETEVGHRSEKKEERKMPLARRERHKKKNRSARRAEEETEQRR